MIKLNIYKKSDLEIIKALPWSGGATITHKTEMGTELYYTVFLKPSTLWQKYVTKKVLNGLTCTFVQDKAA